MMESAAASPPSLGVLKSHLYNRCCCGCKQPALHLYSCTCTSDNQLVATQMSSSGKPDYVYVVSVQYHRSFEELKRLRTCSCAEQVSGKNSAPAVSLHTDCYMGHLHDTDAEVEVDY